MDNYPELTMSLTAINRAKDIVKGNFALDTEGSSDVAEMEQVCVRAFNAY